MIGPYKIIKQLGDGGFGKTYLAKHAIIDEYAVIKQSWYNNADSKAVLLKEAKLLWNVNHWALPTVKDVIQNDDDDILMVVSYIPGDELQKYADKNGVLEPETVCWISQRVLAGLHYLHYQGIIHRDVKPSNIIVNFDTHIATLVDFGLSSIRPDKKKDDSGYTPLYASPEQINSKPPLPESDIYSLGLTMMFLLEGEDAVVQKQLKNTPDALKDLIYKMICVDPLNRLNSASDISSQINDIRYTLFGRYHIGDNK